MEWCRVHLLILVSMLFFSPVAHSWGYFGHLITCRIAQARLNNAAANAVEKLLPESAKNDLGSLCSWADNIKFHYRWSSALHFTNTPDKLCRYKYRRDCKDRNNVRDRCVVGAINNYTTQLLNFGNQTSKYNLTEALLFLSHFMGDIHQPLHVGFTSDKGGATIGVKWYQRIDNLHHVWDTSIIQTQVKMFYFSDADKMILAMKNKIRNKWENRAKRWETCRNKMITCPDIYASESIKAACRWAYRDVKNGSVLQDKYFQSRSLIVNQRLAQGGVRLAATLNRIFK